ncbi:MAG TPA: hypothetical protein VK988_06005 [Acidimicrobiales bacterium]|nr:hypothetical protein [Acidimicrobiales bacterium]
MRMPLAGHTQLVLVAVGHRRLDDSADADRDEDLGDGHLEVQDGLAEHVQGHDHR